MDTIPVKLTENGTAPIRQNPQDAGLDLHAAATAVIPVRKFRMIPLGIHTAIPNGHTGLLTIRSGLSVRNRLSIINAPGIIDAGYRGEIMAGIFNHGDEPYRVEKGDRVAQLTIIPVIFPTPQIVDELPESDGRGENGFGSTGKN